MDIKIEKLKGYNNGVLVEKVLPKAGRTTAAGIIIPENFDKPVHVFSKVLSVGWSCSRRIKVGDIIVSEKAMNTTLKNPKTGRELQFIRETDIIGQVDAEDVTEDVAASPFTNGPATVQDQP